MSEKYYGTSPYAFCGNNPVNFVDPDGMRIFIINNSIEYQWKEVEGIWGFYDTNDNLFSIGDGQFADMVSRHLSEIMTTNTGSSLVQDLVKHSESVFIRGGMNGYDSSKKALGFNPFVAFPVSVAFPAEHTNPRQGASEAFPYASAERATDGDWWL